MSFEPGYTDKRNAERIAAALTLKELGYEYRGGVKWEKTSKDGPIALGNYGNPNNQSGAVKQGSTDRFEKIVAALSELYGALDGQTIMSVMLYGDKNSKLASDLQREIYQSPSFAKYVQTGGSNPSLLGSPHIAEIYGIKIGFEK